MRMKPKQGAQQEGKEPKHINSQCQGRKENVFVIDAEQVREYDENTCAKKLENFHNGQSILKAMLLKPTQEESKKLPKQPRPLPRAMKSESLGV